VLTRETKEQAEARVVKGADAVRTALEMATFSLTPVFAAASVTAPGSTRPADENLCDLRRNRLRNNRAN
jgi:hypothetical protein